MEAKLIWHFVGGKDYCKKRFFSMFLLPLLVECSSHNVTVFTSLIIEQLSCTKRMARKANRSLQGEKGIVKRGSSLCFYYLC